MERVVDQASSWLPGDPLDPATAMGPTIDAGQFNSAAD
jgi:acyl-CoA reductase-like NAD-dependent aldehyde dehydrogenase